MMNKKIETKEDLYSLEEQTLTFCIRFGGA